MSGLIELDAPISRLRVVRRGGGHDDFIRRAQLLNAARVGVAVALVAPLVCFIANYLWTRRTVDGLLIALLDAAIDTAISTVGAALSHPVATAAFLLTSWALSRFAFRR